jgi:putative transposase
MKLSGIRRRVWDPIRHIVGQIEGCLKHWTQPNSDSLLLGSAGELTRSRGDLIAENAFVRQQVIVLKRQTPRPRLGQRDRALLVLLASKVRGWKEALLVVKPDTLLKWHRAGFSLGGMLYFSRDRLPVRHQLCKANCQCKLNAIF